MIKGVILVKYLVYYSTKLLPQSLIQYAFKDRNILIIKDGLSEINGMKCPRFVMQVLRKSQREDKQRITDIENILKSLVEAKAIEDFIRG